MQPGVYQLIIWLNLFLIAHLCAALPADADVITSSGSTPICDVSINDDDADVDTVTLTDCVEKWKDVLSDYVRALRRDKKYDICVEYEDLRKCLTSYVSLCRRYGGDTSLDWMAVVNHLEPICINKSKNHVKMSECLVEEMGGVLSSRCDEYHEFNLKQNTRNDCHFLRETIHCRTSLVSSGCGAAAGKLAFSLLRYHHRKLANKLKCHVGEQHTFKTFSYSSSCGRNFLADIETCTTRHLTSENVAEFHDDNDLVSIGEEDDFRSSCGAYRSFASCLDPINETCSDGMAMFLQYEGNLRRYMLKMDHICQDSVINTYASSLSCYQSVMSSGHLSQCNVHWNNLRPWLSNITAYQFFCDPSHVNTVNLLQEIQKSHMCHRGVFRSECGQNASTIMADLMDRALRDPLYLRLGFRPDCQLHRQSPSEDGPRHSSTAAYDDNDDDKDDNDDGNDDNDDGNADNDDEELDVYVTAKKDGGDAGDVIVDVRRTPSAPYWTRRPEVKEPSRSNGGDVIATLRHHRPFEIITVALSLVFVVHSVLLSLVTSSWNVIGVVDL